ncbi:hypothetical protein E1B28_009313 [Marasmius oreades]|uniref:Uncharacterized protein n=1 Tax=Marasmius oreades TaxID=181124 RepID=A0A9P7UU68_9AGAR|nr:uncharacterized protein E1B28_009313 [Marasmius oreades]KAG7093016.1 hypothetical protein E1B28_009313 [Marasmius oreades]
MAVKTLKERQFLAANASGRGGDSDTNQRLGQIDVRQLQQALAQVGTRLAPWARNDRDAWSPLNLIKAAVGALSIAKFNPESFEHGNASTATAPLLSQEQKVALLLCEAVLLFVEQVCSIGEPPKPIKSSEDGQLSTVMRIQAKYRGEQLEKIVIKYGLPYLTHPHLLGLRYRIRHFQPPSQYFHSRLRDALQRAQLDPPEDLRKGGKELLVADVKYHG